MSTVHRIIKLIVNAIKVHFFITLRQGIISPCFYLYSSHHAKTITHSLTQKHSHIKYTNTNAKMMMNKSNTRTIAVIVAIITLASSCNVHAAAVDVPTITTQLLRGQNSNNSNNNNNNDIKPRQHQHQHQQQHQRKLTPVPNMMECVLFLKDVQYINGLGEESWSCEFKIFDTMTIMDVTGLTKESIDKMEPLSGEAILKIPSQANAFIIIEEKEELDNDDVSIDYSLFSKTHLYIPKESESIIEIEILDINDRRHVGNRKKRRMERRQRLLLSESAGQEFDRNLADSNPGELVTLVVRGIDNDGVTNSASDSDLAADIFTDEVNLKTQYAACSHDQLIISPAVGVGIVDGVTNVTVNLYSISSGNVEKYNFAQEIAKQTKDKFITSADDYNNLDDELDDIFDLVMYCQPPGMGSWLAYAYIGRYDSYYNDYWCQRVSAQMHEIGHNLGLAHSGTAASGPYGDTSGMMGYSYNEDNTPEECFNAAKNYQLGWYDNQKDSYSPIAIDNIGTSKEFILTGIDDYDKNNGTIEKLITLRLECGIENGCTEGNIDYYIGYNAATGPNTGTKSAKNMITILEKENSANSIERNGYGMSRRISTLNPLNTGDSYTLEQYGGTQLHVTVEVVSISFDDKDVTIRVSTSDSSPTQSPTQSCGGDDVDTGRFKLELSTDAYGSETSWSIQEQSLSGTDNYVYQKSTYGLASYSTTIFPDEKNSFCLVEGECYIFDIKDTYGDGICCAYGYGYYKGFLDGVEIFTGGTFTFNEQQTFCVIGDVVTTTPVKTSAPSSMPSAAPSFVPSSIPTQDDDFLFVATNGPTITEIQTTASPTKSPTLSPTKSPTVSPTNNPTEAPTKTPTISPTVSPTNNPTEAPTKTPTISPTKNPTLNPTEAPTKTPTISPTKNPTLNPTEAPTKTPTISPTNNPTLNPTEPPTKTPTISPTNNPTLNPTEPPTNKPPTSCVDGKLKFKGKRKRNCKWVGKKQTRKRCRKRTRDENRIIVKVFDICLETCGKC